MSETTNQTKTLIVTLHGNLARDPELRSTQERVISFAVYDTVIDGPIEREFRKPGRELHTFTLAVNGKDAEGNPVTRWHRCVDWQGLTAKYRKGDFVSLSGFFKVRTYEKDGETKEVRELVVTDARLRRLRVREQVA